MALATSLPVIPDRRVLGAFAAFILVSGGASTMWDMDPTWVNPSLLRSIVDVFVRQGGQIFQGNMTSVEDLRRAFDDPDAYPNLIVRELARRLG